MGEKSCFCSMPEAIEAIRQGRMVIVTDDERRENEGDLICAAEAVTPDAINFMSRFGRGLICVSMDREQVQRMGLSRMSSDTVGELYSTAFMESVDSRVGITTGISAFDRAKTIKDLVNPEGKPSDIRRPGHVFPLEAVEGGVLRRPGHTEASADLARMAGFRPAGVICEIMRDDGEMARLPDLIEFSAHHNIPMISIAEMISYRQQTEKLVEFIRQVDLPTDFGTFKLKLYHSFLDDGHHLALVYGDPEKQDTALVRIHSECLTGDVFGSLRCDCGSQLRNAMEKVAKEGHGVVLYMRQEGRGIGLAPKIHAYELQDQGMDTVEANIHLGFPDDLRDYGSGAQILADLGLHKIRLMTNNPRKIEGLEKYGLSIVERIPIVVGCSVHNERYLSSKKEKMGHML